MELAKVDNVSPQPPRQWQVYQYWNPLCGARSHALEASCVPCEPGLYSLQQAVASGSDNTITVLSQVQCRVCPYGADCSVGGAEVRTLPGFWRVPPGASGGEGTAEVESLSFVPCPSEYCCSPEGGRTACSEEGACSGHRAGTLCGTCEEGFAAVVGSAACRLKSECGGSQLTLYLAGSAVFACCYALLFLFKAHTREEREAAGSDAASSPSPDGPDWRKARWTWSLPEGIVESTHFYAQMAGRVASVTELSDVVKTALGIADLAMFHAFELCPWPSLTPLAAQFLGFGMPVAVAVPLSVAQCCARRSHDLHHASSRRRVAAGASSSSTQALQLSLLASGGDTTAVGDSAFKGDDHTADSGARGGDGASGPAAAAAHHGSGGPGTVGAWTQLLSFSADKILETCFRLLRCESLGGGQRVLFYVGTVACDVWWQPFVGVGAGVALLLPVVLLAASLWQYWVEDHTGHDLRLPGWMASALHSLQAPYWLSLHWWWFVQLAHRVVLTAVDTVVGDDQPATAAALMAMANAVALASHTVMRPFAEKAANTLQTVYLTLLVILSAFAAQSAALRVVAPPVNPEEVPAFESWARFLSAWATASVGVPLACMWLWSAASWCRAAVITARNSAMCGGAGRGGRGDTKV